MWIQYWGWLCKFFSILPAISLGHTIIHVPSVFFFYWSIIALGLPWWLSGKESACSAGASGDVGSVPGSRRSPGGGNGNPLQYSCLENGMDRGDWRATGHRVTKGQTRLSARAYITALQCCVSFCCIMNGVIVCIHISPLLEPPFHTRPSCPPWALSWELPVLQSSVSLAVSIPFTHGSVYMPMLLSQFILPFLSPLLPSYPQVPPLQLHLYL